MLPFFTDPYTDELIYSAIARYHFYSGNIDCKDTLEEVFNSRSVIPSLEIGSYFEGLSSRIGSKYTSDYLINRHTIFPYYSPFLPKKRQEELKNDIKHGNGQGLYTKLGLISGSICKKEGIHYCPNCAKKEIEELGETYIHREHQLQGVLICPHDGAFLKKYPMDKTNASRIAFIRIEGRLLDFRDIRIVNDRQFYLLSRLSEMAYFLLENNLRDVTKEHIYKKYKSLLHKKGFITPGGRVKQNKLYHEFTQFYGSSFLSLLESDIDNGNEFNWLRVITRDFSRAVHPIRHLMFIHFLQEDIKMFFDNMENDFYPFGVGPWPCLNKTSVHYKKDVVTQLHVSRDYKTGVPVGTFTCKCGFVYSRKGPDQNEKDRYRFGRIKQFGKHWEEQLIGYLNKEKYGLRELARLMGCDPKTIKKYTKELKNGLSKGNIKLTNGQGNPEKLGKIESYRITILNEISFKTNATRKEIRVNCQKEYSYLYKNDRDWLFSNLPLSKERTRIPNFKVDWDKRDSAILKKIKAKHRELLQKEKPVRITKSRLGKELGLLTTLERHLDKLPQISEYFFQHLETIQQFQWRRCTRIIDQKLKKNEPIKLWEIQRLAGLKCTTFHDIKDDLLNYILSQEKRMGSLWVKKL